MNLDNYAFTYNSEYDGTQSVFDGSTTTAAAVPYTYTSTSTQHFNAAYAFSSLRAYPKNR